VIDAHQHFWQMSRGDYGWLTEDLGVLYRDHGPDDLEPHLRRYGIARSVAVQAAPTVEETRHLLAIADATAWVAGVVGWIDMASAGATRDLEELARHPALCGIRPMIQDIADPDWMLAGALTPVFDAIAQRGLAFDALIRPGHLPRLLRLMDRHPELRVVVDHAAKPAIAEGGFDPWARGIEELARETLACCKLSGLVTEAGENWSDDTLRPYVDHLLACFGPERLMWGSDWPVSRLAGGYVAWREATLRLLSSLDPTARACVLGGTAERFYRLSSA